jgi:hypothetical protein
MKKLAPNHKNFLSRSFNTLRVSGDEVIKSSKNSDKIISEYAYFYSVPEELRKFLVKPYDLSVIDGEASYRMKFWRSLDAGAQYSSGQLSLDSFIKIIESVDMFSKVAKRNSRTTSQSWPSLMQTVVTKARTRALDLRGSRALSLCDRLEQYILNTVPHSIDSVESHGDLCLSNIIICEDNVVRFIDPRGTDSIWMDEYYDMAKLSQCILGGYDFIINDAPEMHAPEIKEYFLEYIKSRGLSYSMLRVYEASLFISMCPLHSDRPDHIEKFLDAAEKIMTELGAH